MNYQTVHMNGTDMTVYENECMICMESDDNGVKTVSVKSIPHLEIACKCDYLVHEACLQNWLTNNPACPICKQCLFYNIPQTSKNATSDAIHVAPLLFPVVFIDSYVVLHLLEARAIPRHYIMFL